ncbi:MAG TPA: PEP-CTERM sorting domain-containing protein [Rariglobus sp.]
MNTPCSSSRVSGFSRLALAVPAFFLAGAVAHAEAVTSWTQSSGSVSGLTTDSPSFATGSNSFKGATPTYTLDSVGDTLTFSGSVVLSFATNGGDGAFRWGAFNTNSGSDVSDKNWSGYLTANKLSGSVPLYEKDAGSGGWNSTSAEGYAQVSSGITGGLSNFALSSGTYNFSFSLERKSTGVLVSWSLVSTTNSYSLSGSWLDTTPVTYTYNEVVIQATGSFGQTSAAFSDMDVTFTSSIPEPSSASLLMGAVVLLGLLCRRPSRRRGV